MVPIPALGQQSGRIKEILPVYPGPATAHHLLGDPVFDFFQSHSLEFQTSGMILPLQGQLVSIQNHVLIYTSYPFKIMEVFLQCFSGLSMDRLIGNVGVLFIPAHEAFGIEDVNGNK